MKLTAPQRRILESKWGWAQRGEDPPPPPEKKELTPKEKQKRYAEKAEKERERRDAAYHRQISGFPERDVSDELLAKQAEYNRKRGIGKSDK